MSILTEKTDKLRISKQRHWFEVMDEMLERKSHYIIREMLYAVPWISKDAKSHSIYDMETSHILNASKMLEKVLTTPGIKEEHSNCIYWETYIKMFRFELRQRYKKTKDVNIFTGLL
jgi:hypothetical protein